MFNTKSGNSIDSGSEAGVLMWRAGELLPIWTGNNIAAILIVILLAITHSIAFPAVRNAPCMCLSFIHLSALVHLGWTIRGSYRRFSEWLEILI